MSEKDARAKLKARLKERRKDLAGLTQARTQAEQQLTNLKARHTLILGAVQQLEEAVQMLSEDGPAAEPEPETPQLEEVHSERSAWL